MYCSHTTGASSPYWALTVPDLMCQHFSDYVFLSLWDLKLWILEDRLDFPSFETLLENYSSQKCHCRCCTEVCNLSRCWSAKITINSHYLLALVEVLRNEFYLSPRKSSRETLHCNLYKLLHVKSADGEQRKIKDVMNGILYRLGPWPQLKIRSHLDQILSFNVRADDRREESESDTVFRPWQQTMNCTNCW